MHSFCSNIGLSKAWCFYSFSWVEDCACVFNRKGQSTRFAQTTLETYIFIRLLTMRFHKSAWFTLLYFLTCLFWCQPCEIFSVHSWWLASFVWSGCTFLDWPRWWPSYLWAHGRYIVFIVPFSYCLWPHHLCSSLMHHGTVSLCAGFICPFVPLLPIACILINVYLLINLGWVSNHLHAVLLCFSSYTALLLSCFFGFIYWENYRGLCFNKCASLMRTRIPYVGAP